MKLAGLVNIGQLAREQYGINKVYLVGFGTYAVSVIAGEAWGALMEELEVPEAKEGSIEHQLHLENTDNRYLLFNTEELQRKYETSIRHRAIGVVFDPERERYENYVPTKLSQRYNAFFFG